LPDAIAPTKGASSSRLAAVVARGLREGALIVFGAVALVLLLALASFDPQDPGFTSTGEPGPVANLIGPIGAFLADVFLEVFGGPAFLFPVLLGLFGGSVEPEQHMAQAVFRCVENGVPMVRAANTGVSCAISPIGLRHVLEKNGRTSDFAGALPCVLAVPQQHLPTLYNRWGDWILARPAALLFLVVLFARPGNKPKGALTTAVMAWQECPCSPYFLRPILTSNTARRARGPISATPRAATASLPGCSRAVRCGCRRDRPATSAMPGPTPAWRR